MQVTELDACALVDYAVHVVTHGGTGGTPRRTNGGGEARFDRTAATGLLFNGLEEKQGPKSGVVTLAGFEPAIFTLKG